MADGLRALCGLAEEGDWRPAWRGAGGRAGPGAEPGAGAAGGDPNLEAAELVPPGARAMLRDAEAIDASLGAFLASLDELQAGLGESDGAAVRAKLAALSESRRLLQSLEALSAQKAEDQEALAALERLFDLYSAATALGETLRAQRTLVVDATVSERLEKTLELEGLLRGLRGEVDEAGFALRSPGGGDPGARPGGEPGREAGRLPRQPPGPAAARNAAMVSVSGAMYSATGPVLRNLDDSITQISQISSRAARAIEAVSVKEFSAVTVAARDLGVSVPREARREARRGEKRDARRRGSGAAGDKPGGPERKPGKGAEGAPTDGQKSEVRDSSGASGSSGAEAGTTGPEAGTGAGPAPVPLPAPAPEAESEAESEAAPMPAPMPTPAPAAPPPAPAPASTPTPSPLHEPPGPNRLISFGIAPLAAELAPAFAPAVAPAPAPATALPPAAPEQPPGREEGPAPPADPVAALLGPKLLAHVSSFVPATDHFDAIRAKFDTTGFQILNRYLYDNFSCFSSVYAALEAVLARREKVVAAFGRRCLELLLERYSIAETISSPVPRGLWLYYFLLRVYVTIIKDEGRALYGLFALDTDGATLQGGSLAGAVNPTLVLREQGEAGGFVAGAPVRGAPSSELASPSAGTPPPGDPRPQGLLRSSLRWIRDAGAGLPRAIARSVAGLFTETVSCGVPAIQGCFERASGLGQAGERGAPAEAGPAAPASAAASPDPARGPPQVTRRNLRKRGPIHLNQLVLDFLVRCFWRLVVQLAEGFSCFKFQEPCRQANRESVVLSLVDGPESARRAQVEQFLARLLDTCLDLTAGLPFLPEDEAGR